jgi:hypothetical protein
MRTLIVITIFSIFCISLKGQNIKTDSTKFTYCELVGMQRLLSTKVTVEIDFGQRTTFFSDKRYKDPVTGKPIVFNSMVDALNYMGKDQWEFVQAYTITYSVGTNSQNVYHFLLKKQSSLIESEK